MRDEEKLRVAVPFFIPHPSSLIPSVLPHIHSLPHIPTLRQPRHDLCQDPTQRRNILSRKPPRLPALPGWRMIGLSGSHPVAARLLRSPRRQRFGPQGNHVRRRPRRRPTKKGIRMFCRRIAAVAIAAGCLLSQTGCTGFGSTNNSCQPQSSGCCLTSGGGLFSRMFGSSSSAPPATCCAPASPCCVPASPCGSGCSGSPIVTSGFDAGYTAAPGGGAPGCNCGRGDPFQFTGMQGAPSAPITTIPGPMSGVPINVGPDIGSPMPTTPQFVPTPQMVPQPMGPIGPPPGSNQGPRIVPVPQMQPPVGAGFQQWHP